MSDDCVPVEVERLPEVYEAIRDKNSDTLKNWIQEVLFPLNFNNGVPVSDPLLRDDIAKRTSIFDKTTVLDKRVKELQAMVSQGERNAEEERRFMKQSIEEMFVITKEINENCIEFYTKSKDSGLWFHKKTEVAEINGRVINCCYKLSDFVLKWLHHCGDEQKTSD